MAARSPSIGGHRIFLGYAAGVGKTYAMLREGLERAEAGEDVVVGFLEPHARPETVALAESLERVPPLNVPYHGGTFAEMDVDAVIARGPEWVLVDELAHRVAPGTRHVERWQAVEEIRAAGIGVMSTVNVQHVDSQSDFVLQVTGVAVIDSIPDRLLLEADEVIVADISPARLIARLQRGDVFAPGDAGRALANFFRLGALTALRERTFDYVRGLPAARAR